MLMLYFGKIPDASLFVPMQSINRPNIDFIDVFSIKKYLLQEQPRTSMTNNDEFPRTVVVVLARFNKSEVCSATHTS